MNLWHDVPRDHMQTHDFWAVIEIEKGSKNKYELDKETGALRLDRTYAEDGDPLDVLVLSSEGIRPMSVVRCYPIGVMVMHDGGKQDEKILAIPFGDPAYNGYSDISQLPAHISAEMQHFFSVYKNLEGTDTEIGEVYGREKAEEIIHQCLEAYRRKFPDKQ